MARVRLFRKNFPPPDLNKSSGVLCAFDLGESEREGGGGGGMGSMVSETLVIFLQPHSRLTVKPYFFPTKKKSTKVSTFYGPICTVRMENNDTTPNNGENNKRDHLRSVQYWPFHPASQMISPLSPQVKCPKASSLGRQNTEHPSP